MWWKEMYHANILYAWQICYETDGLTVAIMMTVMANVRVWAFPVILYAFSIVPFGIWTAESGKFISREQFALPWRYLFAAITRASAATWESLHVALLTVCCASRPVLRIESNAAQINLNFIFHRTLPVHDYNVRWTIISCEIYRAHFFHIFLSHVLRFENLKRNI